MNNKIKSIVSKLKKCFNRTVIILLYKNKDYRKVVYKSKLNRIAIFIFKYNYELKEWIGLPHNMI